MALLLRKIFKSTQMNCSWNSEKTTVVPNNDSTRSFAKLMNDSGIPMTATRAGVDIGIDSSSANSRAVGKQIARIAQSKRKAHRAGLLTKRKRKAKRIAMSGINP